MISWNMKFVPSKCTCTCTSIFLKVWSLLPKLRKMFFGKGKLWNRQNACISRKHIAMRNGIKIYLNHATLKTEWLVRLR